MSENIKHIIALIIVLAMAGGMYFVIKNGLLFKGPEDRAEAIQQDTERLKREIITPLRKLNSVQFDQSFFESPEYTALEDKSIPLREPDLERPNPFAPIGQ